MTSLEAATSVSHSSDCFQHNGGTNRAALGMKLHPLAAFRLRANVGNSWGDFTAVPSRI